jgi:FAD/FMN-containing dehydrogenase
MTATIHGAPVGVLHDEAIWHLGQRLSGEVIRPGSPNYDGARRVLNPEIDRYPAVIVRPRDTEDVTATVNFARDSDLPLAVRGGGHSLAGYGTVEAGVVIDLSSMTGLTIDSARAIATAQPGLTWGRYAARAQEFGLATPAGDVATVGVGGLTLGGGVGWLARKYGLTIDSLLSAEVVTADGRLLTASTEENPDLFWALRGGGGNFGVVTEFRFRLHSVGMILGGAIVYPATPAVLRDYAAVAQEAPDELTTITMVMNAPPLPFLSPDWYGRPVVMITVCYVGDLDAGQRALEPLRGLAGSTPLADATGPMPYPALYDLTAEVARIPNHAMRSGFMDVLDPSTIETILVSVNRGTSPTSLVQLRVLGGAMARVPAEATAFGHRSKPIIVSAINVWDDDSETQTERHLAWTEEFWQVIAPRTDGAYVNFLGDEGDERVRAAYPEATYVRLAEVKRRYDPDNLFRVNANIRPD